LSLIGQYKTYPAVADRLLSLIGIEVHWAILQYTLGLSFMAFIAYLIYMKTNDEKWRKLSWTLFKGFVIVFAVGAATGTASEFGLVLLWPNLTEAAGRYIYFPLYAEVFAFLMEVVFVYMVYYGWNKFGRKFLAVLMLLAFSGAWYSAAMIVSVNSFMVAPTGIEPAYDVQTGQWLYDQGYPKMTLAVPKELVPVLNVTLLQQLGMDIKGETDNAVIVALPVSMVQRLAYEAWNGYTVGESILALVANKTTLAANPEIADLTVKEVVDQILITTVQTVGVTTITFKSPVYPGSILHVLGSALTVASFTVMAAYALRLRRANGAGKEYIEYARAGFKYAAVFALIVIVIQGFVSGHMQGTEIAMYNPEKFAAMEGTSESIFAFTRVIPGAEKLVAFLAYGDPNAPLPNYDAIPQDYCFCKATPEVYQQDAARIGDCRPPLLLHYIYYAKLTMGVLLGLYAAAVVYFLLLRKREADQLPGILLALAPLTILVSQTTSFFGWAVREIGRKPFTIYGIMTTDVAHTSNPADPVLVGLVALFFIIVLVALAYSVWKFLWIPGRPTVQEGP